MDEVVPTLGALVLLKLDEDDVAAINRRRKDAKDDMAYRAKRGYIAHVGNQVTVGEQVPAVITKIVKPNQHTFLNLKALLDGNDDFWAVSRTEGQDDGQWSWA